MRSGHYWVGALLAIILATPAARADDKKTDSDPPTKTDKDKKQAADKLVAAGSMTGKVTDWDKDERVITLDVKLQIPDGIDEGAAEAIGNKQAELIRLQATPIDARNANSVRDRLKQVANIQKDIAQNQAKLYKFKEVNQKFVVNIAENATVRTLELPPVFDEKGNVIRRTAQEMKELRGDTRLPGYKGELGDLKADQMVRIVIVHNKSTKIDPPSRSDKKSDKPDAPDEKPPIKLDKSYHATMVVIGTSDDAKK